MARMAVALNSGGSSVKGVGYLMTPASNMRRAKIIDWLIGSSQSPADAVFTHIMQRGGNTSLTGTARTPNAIDQADTLASTIVATDTVTADSSALTAGAFNANVAINQRASFRVVTAPYMELMIPATASSGYLFGVSAATTTTFAYSVSFEEL